MNRVPGKNILVVVLIFLLPGLAGAGEKGEVPEIILDPAEARPGEIVVVTVKAPSGVVTGTFNGRALHFIPSRESAKALAGIDLLTEPGTYPLEVLVNGAVVSRTITVVKKDFPVQRLTLPRDMVELSPENQARVERDAAVLRGLWSQETPRQWAGPFLNPRPGEIISAFGLRRVINNIPKNSHTGVDVRAAEGMDVVAPNSGIVALVDDQFYAGNAVVIDHGQGLFTMFFHLSRVFVTQGQRIEKGDRIGLVGSTGRSSGPHLHWGVRLQGARVDPLKLLELKLE